MSTELELCNEGPWSPCALEPACPRHAAGTRFPMADPVSPEEVEAELDALVAASEPQRRAERLEAGVVDLVWDEDQRAYVDPRTGRPDPHTDRLRSIEASSLAGRADSVDSGW